MIRYIKLANQKNRDAEVTIRSLNPKASVTMALESGDKITNKRVVKGTSQSSTQSLLAKYSEKPKDGVDFQMQLASLLAEDLITSDPECDFKINLSTSEIIHQGEKIDNFEDSKKQIEEIFAAEVLENVKKGWEKV